MHHCSWRSATQRIVEQKSVPWRLMPRWGYWGIFFTGKSGQIGGALYTVNTKHEIFERYTECYEQIREACHRKGRILSDNPRSRNCLLYNILTQIRLRRVTKAHNCPLCSTNLPERIQELRKELARADDDLDCEDIQVKLDYRLQKICSR